MLVSSEIKNSYQTESALVDAVQINWTFLQGVVPSSTSCNI